MERESLRNTLLASISHDLRTPLAVMAGAASTLAEQGATLAEESKAELARSIEVKAREMSDLVSNVLDLMRFQSGQVVLRRDWQPLEDLVGAALERLEERLRAIRWSCACRPTCRRSTSTPGSSCRSSATS